MVQPFVRELFADVEKSDAFRRVLLPLKRGTSAAPEPGTGGTKAGAGRTRVSGLTPAAKALHLPLFRRAAQRPLLVIVRDNRAAEALLPILRAACELTGAADPDATIALPAYDVLPFENQSPHPEIQEERAAALWKIATGAAEIVVAPIESALMRMHPAEHYSGLARTLRKGESIDSERLVEHLNLVGYVKVDVVEMPGQYAVRGGILDVYSPEMDRPARAEFFGDEIESLRKFDPASQRSQNPLDEAVLLPLTETAVSEETLAAIHTRLSGGRITGAEATVEEAVVAGGVSVFPGWELYAPVAGASSTLLDVLPEAAIFVDEPTEVGREVEAFWEKLDTAHEQSGVGKLVLPGELFLSSDEWQSALERRAGGSLEHLGIETSETETITLSSQPTPKFHGAVPALVEEVQRLTADGRRVLFCAGSTGEMERLADIFTEYSVPFRMGMRTGTAGGETFLDEAAYFTEDVFATTLVRAYVPDGFLLPEVKLAVFGSRDLFDESEASVSRPIKQKSKTAAFMSDFRDLAVGDYVVHVEHGIGQYCGLREIEQEGAKAEFMVLEYAEAAKLYVPLTRLDLIQKYRSAEGAKPVLSRLGTAAWLKTKTRVKKAMKEMADELLKLYAARKTAEGHKFPVDTDWQREFEDAFEFQETEDQTAAVADIKADMQSQQPMDRLLCGDVGYGKTEVAMRAAFKAVSDGKQVAVLAPTTVLAFQHFETFKERFKQFPLTIEMISRFRTPKQQKAIVEKVEQGKVDVLIGTHRLLSKDIKFQDLGLLVVDEEQRFGVRHKERLKQMKREVDVLTMSATPIPRTLHMAVVGLRDMSVIETPPKDRMAIQTVVAAFDEKLIRGAIEQEIERGGQVYFVHNRVESIYEIAAKIKELVPKARVLVGHGQMSETELESVMLGFIRHEADVLVATTIIENGLDIPLCNTILINRADRHGLSELYQLRGRVGRSNRRAYAYLLVPPEQELTAIARRRLAALKEFSDLGAGFKIAALDLELRGAGNLLGGEQSGHIDAVGFELYTSMLERTIKELRGEISEEAVETQLNLGLNIRIPPEYIAEENQRLRMYKRVAAVESVQQLADVRDELTDRYGEPPAAVRNLLEYAELKLASERVGVAGIDRRRDIVNIKFNEKAVVDPEKLAQFVAKERGAQFTPAGVLRFQLKSTRPEDVLDRLKELLSDLAAEELRIA